MAYRLLQISDSAFPKGSFAHSLGLETYVAEGLVEDGKSLQEFAESVLLNSAGPLEGVYLREAYRCADADDFERLLRLDRRLSAAKPVASLRKASRTVGRQFLRTTTGYVEHDFLARYERRVRQGSSPGHHAVALGVAGCALELGLRRTLESFFYGAASGLASAAIRLAPLGQTEGQRVVAACEETARQATETALALPLEDAYSVGPGHELRAMTHLRLHTRLFVS